MITKCITITILISLLFGCASARKDYNYMAEKEYQSKPALTTSLMNGENLTEASIQKILSSKIVLPKTLSVAVIRIADSSYGLNFQTIDNQIAEEFYKKDNWGTRVKTLIPVPQIMIASPITLSGLRQSAVILQSDLLIVVKPSSYSEWKFQWLDENKAKGITTLEVLALDTRTGIVPFSSIVTEQAEVFKSNEKDYSIYELEIRAKKESEKKALLQVTRQVSSFLSSGI